MFYSHTINIRYIHTCAVSAVLFALSISTTNNSLIICFTFTREHINNNHVCNVCFLNGQLEDSNYLWYTRRTQIRRIHECLFGSGMFAWMYTGIWACKHFAESMQLSSFVWKNKRYLILVWCSTIQELAIRTRPTIEKYLLSTVRKLGCFVIFQF